MMHKRCCTLWRRLTVLWRAGALTLVFGVGAAQAQAPAAPPTDSEPIDKHTNVSAVEIALNTRMDCPTAPGKVWVVVNDIDFEVEATLTAGVWKAKTRKFDAVQGHVSLRIGSKPPARTDCRKPSALARDRLNWVATYTFPACDAAPVKQVQIHTLPTTPSVHVSYVRVLSAVQEASVDCAERLALPLSGTINAVRYESEKLHLQIDRESPDPRACGLVVNDPAATKYAKKSADGLVFEKEGVSSALLELRSKGKACSGPSFSLPALELDRDRLNRTKLSKLYLTVKPQPELGMK